MDTTPDPLHRRSRTGRGSGRRHILGALVVAVLMLSACTETSEGGASSAFSVDPSTTSTAPAATIAEADGPEVPEPTADTGDICDAQRTKPWPVTDTDADLLGLARTGALPRIPVPSIPPPVISTRTDSSSASEYFGPDTPDIEARTQQAVQAGFAGATDISYLAPPHQHGVRVVELGDPIGAVAFARAHLGNICADPMADLRELPGHGGIVYRATGDSSDDLVVATFVFGRSEITLFVCSCIPGDRIAIAIAWYERIVQDLANGPANDIA